jgi:hypothetical protein
MDRRAARALLTPDVMLTHLSSWQESAKPNLSIYTTIDDIIFILIFSLGLVETHPYFSI